MFPSAPALAAQIASQPFKRSQLGLFHGKMIQFGNNVPFSKKKTRRTWLPNVQSKNLFSNALDKWVSVKLTTAALKTINKYEGGLDEYVTRTRHKLLGWEGMRIRLAVKQAQEKAVLRETEAATLQEAKRLASEERRTRRLTARREQRAGLRLKTIRLSYRERQRKHSFRASRVARRHGRRNTAANVEPDST